MSKGKAAGAVARLIIGIAVSGAGGICDADTGVGPINQSSDRRQICPFVQRALWGLPALKKI